MKKQFLREKAIQLREEGYSYTQIKNEVNVSKSTLSLWLRNVQVSPSALKRSVNIKDRKIERYRSTMQAKRKIVIRKACDSEKQIISKLSDREIYLIGFGLYLVEGKKKEDIRKIIINIT